MKSLVASPSAAPRHILVVDDHKSNRQLLRAILESEGIEVTEAADGEEALRLLGIGNIHGVISDILMPRIDGIRLCLEVRKDPRFNALPFIFYTANYSSDADRRLALRSGADSYVVKPVSAADVIQVLDQAFGKAAARLGAHRPLPDEVCMMADHNEALVNKLDQKNRDLESLLSRLTESETRFRQVVESINEVFWMIDVTSRRILYVSPAYERIWGRSCQTLHDSPDAWMEAIHPEDRPRVEEAARSIPQSGRYNETYRITRPDGEIRWISDRAFPITGPGGGIERVVGSAEDITERRELEERFLRAQRMEAVGSLASGIAHDMNNILAPIMMAASLLREGIDENQRVQFISTIESSAARGAQLIRQLLYFGRGVDGERAPLRIKAAIAEIEEIVRQTFPRRIEFCATVPIDTDLVMADATQVHQVLLNLSVNARDAMPSGGVLSVVVRNVDVSPATAGRPAEIAPGRFVEITVADTGLGIPPEYRERIFEPFFTTKEIGKGTGLGLSTVIALVKAHGGFMRLESQVGHGTSFHVYLPSLPETDAIRPTEISAEVPGGESETILVVDDEEAIRDLLRATLSRNGYNVLLAADGAEAAAIYARSPETIAAVVTDFDMPFLDGLGLARVIRAVNPKARILVTTGAPGGLAAAERTATGTGFDLRHVLMKPFTPDAMLSTLRKVVLDSK